MVVAVSAVAEAVERVDCPLTVTVAMVVVDKVVVPLSVVSPVTVRVEKEGVVVTPIVEVPVKTRLLPARR